MTDLSTTVTVDGSSSRFVYDAGRHLFYYADGGKVFSFNPLTGAVTTVLTVEGTIGGLAITAAGDQLLVGMKDLVPNADPYLQLGTVYRVPMASAGDPDSYQTLHFQASYMDVGVFDMAMVADDELVITEGTQYNFGFVFRMASDFSGTAPIDWNEPLRGSFLIVSEHGRYIMSQEGYSSGGEYQLYDNQTHQLITSGQNFFYNRGRADISEATGLIFMEANTSARLGVYDLGMNLVADLTSQEDITHYIVDGKFNEGGRQLFIWDGTTGKIDIFDTASWQIIGSLQAAATGTDVEDFARNPTGLMGISSDGHFLWLQEGNAYESIDLFSRIHTSQVGTAANNVFYSTQGQDTLNGGSGFDTVSYDAASAGVKVSLLSQGATQNTGGAGSDTLISIEGLIGSAYNDILTGDGNANHLDGGAGADYLTGGGGDDIYMVDNVGDIVVEQASAGTDTVKSSVSYSLSANVENLTLTGTANLNGTGNNLVNILAGNSGNNVLNGGAGADRMIGGAGNDTYYVDNAGDVITELSGGGTDIIYSTVTWSVAGTPDIENLTLTGTANINATGNSLSNTITGNSGINTLTGGAGNDTYIVQAGDTVVEQSGEGMDTIQTSVSYTLSANVENLIMTGTANINAVGNDLANTINGNSGVNTLAGGNGDDVINGGLGADIMRGGAGNDTYYVDNSSDNVQETVNAGTDNVFASASFSINGQYIENLTLTGSGNINATGNGLANILTGNAGSNTLNGGDGDDILNGGAAADILIGGAGNDIYYVDNSSDVVQEYANAGMDIVFAGASFSIAGQHVENLTLTGSGNINATGNGLVNTLTGNAGNNVLDGSGGADIMAGGAGNDIYYVDNSSDVVQEYANAGMDSVFASASFSIAGQHVENLTLTGSGNINATGNGLANVITGNAGNNVLDGSGGADIMAGGAGNDTYYVDDSSDLVQEFANAGMDSVFASASFSIAGQHVENLTLIGSGNIDATGNSLANILTGNSGNNILDGGVGADIMTGGDGNDTYFVDNSSDVVQESANAGTDSVIASANFTLNGLEVENLILTGWNNLNATGNNLANTLIGNAGSNILKGLDGNDILDGGYGADVLIGGSGNDTYYVDNSADVVQEAANGGTDTVFASASFSIAGQDIENLTMTSGFGAINATGNDLANILTGNDGDNILDGGAGADVMMGGGGHDTYYVDSSADVVIEGVNSGFDSVFATVSFSLIGRDVEYLTLVGTGNLNATGNNLNNIIVGNSGNNIIEGGAGRDTLAGGGGNDTFVFGAGSGIDNILDFSNDTINLNAYSHGVTNGAGIIIKQVGSDTTIDLGGGNIITLTGVTPADVTGHIVW